MINFRSNGINNTSYKTWGDIIDKERDTRLKWNRKYKSQEDLDLGWQGVQNQLDFENHMERHRFSIPKPTIIERKPSNFVNNEYIAKVERSRVKPREASPDEKRMLFEGLSRDRQGRWKYLNTRQQYKPEEKYEFPVTSSMSYGWRVYDENNKRINSVSSSLDSTLPPSKYAVRNLVINTFYRDNGVINDDSRDDVVKVRTNR